jgi:hypothetical protein
MIARVVTPDPSLSSALTQTIHIENGESRTECRYHRVFDSYTTQAEVYSTVKDCTACVEGFNSTLYVTVNGPHAATFMSL